MKSYRELQERFSDPLGNLIRFALQEEISTAKPPCVWKKVRDKIRNPRQAYWSKWERQETIFAGSTLSLSIKSDMLYFLIADSILQIIR
ncbi:MAG: hypothetical protein DRI56_00285 [Chloroflexota bacterium]|nr:MAG: hypothetical protein DRI56_00285 [Chloroflexota bacterium]